MNLRSSDAMLSPPLVLLLIALACLISLPGCSGCNWGGTPTTAKAKTKKKDEKPKDELDELAELEKKRKAKLEKPKADFEPLAVRMLPSNDPSPTLKSPIHVKPGHWIALSVTAKTNNFDFP